jgi:hypothetical protein
LNGAVPLHEPFEEVRTFPTIGLPEIVGSPVALGGACGSAEPPDGIKAATARTVATKIPSRRRKRRLSMPLPVIVTPLMCVDLRTTTKFASRS